MRADFQNILLIITDQQAASAISCTGNPWLKTPSLDSLAARGIRFENAYCAYPQCVPSRTSLFYGTRPRKVMKPGTEHSMNANPLIHGIRDEFKHLQLGRRMVENGYQCLYAGKWHVDRWGPTESLPDGEHPFGFQKLASMKDGNVVDSCRSFLSSSLSKEKPFFLVASFDNPHNIHEWSTGKELPQGSIAEPPAADLLPPLPYNFAESADEPNIVRQWREQNKGRFGYFSDEDWRRYRWAYFRLIEKVDAQIGEIIAALDSAGLAESTLIIFTSDHGDMHGAHRLAYKNTFYRESVEVPLIIAGCGVNRKSFAESALVTTGPDIYSTICSVAGLEISADMPGISLLENPGHDYIVSEYIYNEICGYFVATKDWHYSVWDCEAPSEQLFDLVNDPGEMINLARIAPFTEQLLLHRNLLEDWKKFYC